MSVSRILALAASVILFATNMIAATYGTNTQVIPMPFEGGKSVGIQSDVVGPFQNARAYISVSVEGSGGFLLDTYTAALGNIGKGIRRTIVFPNKFTPPQRLPRKKLRVFVVFLEANETYVGEPGPSRSLVLIPHCDRVGTVLLPCVYATGRYWIQSIKVKK